MKLDAFFAENPRFALAYSGGVDSTYLLSAAKEYGCDVKAYFIKSIFQPQFELDDARRMAYMLSAPMTVETIEILKNPDVAANSPDRCYHCKKAIFTRILELAHRDGYTVVCDGTNASDDAGDRAGMQALIELGVRSPLREYDMTKPEIRSLSRAAGLYTHDKPSYACLATRIPTGTEIKADCIDTVAKAEEALHVLGFSDFRIRFFSGAARIQLPEEQFRTAFDKRRKILDTLYPYFDAVFLDLLPRKTEFQTPDTY
ncbi:ATP-dependent sacrificial sulfur transferase LarE [Oscillospiraceae bacterium WX1]